MTLELKGWVVGNIEEFSKKVTSTEKVSMCIKRVASISSLKSRIIEENTLRGFG